MKKWLIASAFIAAIMGFGLFIAVQGAHNFPKYDTPTTTACADQSRAFASWLENQSQLAGEDLKARYGVLTTTADCGSITVSTRIADNDTGHAIAEGACNLLSQAVNDVPGIKDVTVTYGTGKNACYQWPGGPSNF